MRAILFRIVLEPFFSVETIDGMPHVGLGLLLLPWAILGALAVYLTLRVGKAAANDKTAGSEKPGSAKMDATITGAVFAAVPVVAAIFLKVTGKVAGKVIGNEAVRDALVEPHGIPVFGYGLMMFVGIVSATLFAVYNAKKLGVEKDTILDMLMWLVVPGIIGGRLFYIIQKHNEHGILKGKSLPEVLFALVNLPDGGLVFYGAIMGGLLGFLVFCRRQNLNILKMGDIILPSVFVGLGFGRIGCFLFGCCFGGTCSLPWAVQFPKGSVPYLAQIGSGYITSDAATSLPLHPTQIYSSLTAFMLATVLMLYLRHRPYNGSVVAIGWVMYPIARFIIEILRNDELGQFGTGLTISQNISVVLFGTGLTFMALLTSTRGTLFGFNKNPLAASCCTGVR